MKAYEVFVNGTHFLVEFGEGVEKYGFFTNVYVEARNYEDAENNAMQLLREHDELRDSVTYKNHNSPRMCVEEITEIANYHEIDKKIQGLVWYKEELE